MPAQNNTTTAGNDAQSLQDWILQRQQAIAAQMNNQQASGQPPAASRQKQDIAAQGQRKTGVQEQKEEKKEELRLEGFDPKDKNLLEKPGQSTQNPKIQRSQGENKQPEENQSALKSQDGGTVVSEPVNMASDRVNPQVAGANPSDDKLAGPPQNMGGQKNPQALEELAKADIFKLLGMVNITEAEKKKNLDEMEETIWEDFVETDLPEMLAGEQKAQYFDLLKTSPSAEKIINFFGKNLPANFEEKYLQKTLNFKAEIVKEQIETLMLANEGKDPQKIKLLEAAKEAADAGYWKKAEELMQGYS